MKTNLLCVVVLAGVLCSRNAGAYCPYITTRATWGAGVSTTRSMETDPPTHVIIHHSNSPTCLSPEDCKVLVKSLQKRHQKVNNWDDIGYNFLVGEDGNIYEGVGWHRAAGNIPKYDTKSLSICVLGDYTSSLPNQKAMRALKKLLDCAVSRGSLSRNYRLVGHRQLARKDCPGTALYREIESWPEWRSF